MVETGTLMGLFFVCSVEDIRKKQVNLCVLLCSGILAVLFHLYWGSHDIFDMLGGSALGLFVLLCSKITGGKVGEGDGLFLMMTGLFLGWRGNLTVYFLGTFLAGVYGLVQLCRHRKRRHDEIAFVPFLGIAYVILLLLQMEVGG